MPIRANSACHERWSDFEERGGGRHCGSCDVTVVDLTRVTRRTAERLVRDAGSHLCARLRVDVDGQPVFVPETERASRFLGAATLGLLAAACEPSVATEPVPVDATVSILDGASAAGFGGSLMGIERTPLRPLGEAPASVTGQVAEAVAVVLAPAEVVPSEEQLLLTEAKLARGRPRRGHRTTSASISPAALVHPLPPFGSSNPGNVPPPSSHLFLGGISYVP